MFAGAAPKALAASETTPTAIANRNLLISTSSESLTTLSIKDSILSKSVNLDLLHPIIGNLAVYGRLSQPPVTLTFAFRETISETIVAGGEKMETLKDKTVLITGASSGIGEATARLFAREGARLILVARRRERLEKLASDLKSSAGVEALIVALDLRNDEDVAQTLGSLPENWSAVDILVNNAGLVRGLKKFQDMKAEEWRNVLEVNVQGLIAVTNAIVRGMIARGSGHIINLGSIAGHEVYPKGAIYCASKFAVRALTQGMKLDLADTPIRVTSIDPGLVETEFSVVRFDGDLEQAKAPYQGMKPLSGVDVAEAIIWSATRPAHVNIMEMVIFPTAQSSAQTVHRR